MGTSHSRVNPLSTVEQGLGPPNPVSHLRDLQASVLRHRQSYAGVTWETLKPHCNNSIQLHSSTHSGPYAERVIGPGTYGEALSQVKYRSSRWSQPSLHAPGASRKAQPPSLATPLGAGWNMLGLCSCGAPVPDCSGSNPGPAQTSWSNLASPSRNALEPRLPHL